MTRRASTSIDPNPSRWRILTNVAFLLVVAIVIARMTSLEILRDPWDTSPGKTAVLRQPGPATSLVLDLLATVPALLVLARGAIDPSFRLIARWSTLPMFLLGIWTLLSTFWAADKFAAAITATQLFSGLCMLWAISQIVRDWMHLRLVAATCFGLLLVLAAQSLIYHFVDAPADRSYWLEHGDEFLKERGWKPDSFNAIQFEHKLMSGESFGFFSSANTFAAIAVVLSVVSCGIGIQKIRDGDGAGWLAIPATTAIAAAWIILQTKSKTAGATPLLGIAMFFAVFYFRSTLQRFSIRAFWIGAGGVVAVFLAVLFLALHQHGLFPGHFSNSLDFRWKYWVASAHLFVTHPIIGIGWNNFSLHYLAFRLPEASEEIRDPHNFIVRFFVELGFLGGLLLIAWLFQLAWELTQSRTNEVRQTGNIGSVILLAAAGIVLTIFVNVDFNQMGAHTFLELMRYSLFLLLLILGTVLGCMVSPHRREIDSRPAPWLFYCIIMSLALFLIHNLIDFSFFEPGPMFLFFLLVGSALGLTSGHPARKKKTAITAIILIAAGMVWIIAAVFTGEVMAGEQSAFDAAEDIRSAPTDDAIMMRVHFARAAAELRSALDHVPFNADYAMQSARALLSAGQIQQAKEMIRTAIRINPLLIDAYLLQANVELHEPHPDPAVIESSFKKILELNPNDVSLHTEYGQALEYLHEASAAQRQYELAMQYNALLLRGEPKRLNPEQLSDLQSRIARLNHP